MVKQINFLVYARSCLAAFSIADISRF